MNKNKIIEIQKSIIEFLQGKKNQSGEELFDKWSQKLKNDKTSVETSFEIESRIKKKIDNQIAKQEKRNERLYTSRKTGKAIPISLKILRVAATIAIVVGTTLIIREMTMQDDGSVADNLLKYRTQLVPFGEKMKLTLADGSTVFLNSGSEFTFPEAFNDTTREVFLKGEAFFDVSRNEEKPFIIHSGEIRTTVLGTSFNIRAFEEENKSFVTVVSGKVKVDVENKELTSTVFLTPNNQAKFNKRTMSLSKKIVDSDNLTAWKDNVLNFDNLSLDEIAQALERWYNIDVKFTDPSVRDIHFLGKHQNPSLFGVLEAIKYSTNIDYVIQDSVVIFKEQRMK